MHLGKYFNIGDGLAIASLYLAKKAISRAYAIASRKKYALSGNTTLFEYLRSKDFNFIDLSIPDQLAYSSNFLTIKDRKLITTNVNKVISRLLKSGAFDAETENAVKREPEKCECGFYRYRACRIDWRI